MRLRRALWVPCIVLAALAAQSAGATMIKSLSLAETIELSEVIVAGQVVGQRTERVGGELMTRISLRVEESLRGPYAPGARVEFSAYGGALDGRRQVVIGEAIYQKGERVLLQLERIDGRLHTLGLAAGKWTLLTGRDGDGHLVRNLAGLALAGDQRMVEGPVGLDEFRALVLARPRARR